MKRGITPSCGGIIMVPIVSVSRALRPLNLSLAKANPASVQQSTVPSVIDPDTISEFSSALPMSASSRTCSKFFIRFGPGSRLGGIRAMSALDRLAVTIVQ
ncbi:hypothetical protein SCALM49S_06864 [Streptomyces californicus]